MDAPRRVVVVRPATVLLVLGLAAGTTLALLFAYATQRVLIWIMIALFLALALDHVVELLSRRLPRALAIGVTFAGTLALVGAVAFALLPPLVDQVQQFVRAAPSLLDRLAQGRGPFGFLERKFDIVERARRWADEQGAAGALGLGQPLLRLVESVATTLIGALSITFLTLFMLIHGPAWKRNVVEFAPEPHRPLLERVARDVRRAVGGWCIGALAVAAAAGVTASIVLWLLGAPYPIALGLVVALLDPIPFVGATLAAAIGGLVVLAANGLTPALIFVAFFVGYQQIVENHLLVPLVYGRTVQVSSLAVLVAVLLGGELAGIVGALAAIPIAGAVKSAGVDVIEWRRSRRIEAGTADLALLRERAAERPGAGGVVS